MFNQTASFNGQIFFDAGTEYAVLVYRTGGSGPWEFEVIPAGANSSEKKSGNGSYMFFGNYDSEGWVWARVDGGTWFKWEMVAVAKVERTLTMDVNHLWGHIAPARGFHLYEDGDSISLSATPDPGYTFKGWTGHSDCSDGNVTMNGDRSCTANFELIQIDHTLTMSSSPANGGTTSPSSGGHSYPESDQVPLIASPAQGYTFTGWTGHSDCSDGNVTMNGDRSCTAGFKSTTDGGGGFDFGGGSEGGGGSFSQSVSRYGRAIVGTIPVGVSNLTIDLTAENDLDIELWDGDTFVVGWEADGVKAQIYSAFEITRKYGGVSITWSGWNGTNGSRGNEFIRLEGTTQNEFVMKVFGFRAGSVDVEYSYGSSGGSDPAPSGIGTFSQSVSRYGRAIVGTIPVGVSNLTIDLTAENDLDIELWDGDTFVVGWEADGVKAQIYSAFEITRKYGGVSITWSGWNGTNGSRGNEFIRLEGTTQNEFVMKVFGFRAGSVHVNYWWGPDTSVPTDVVIQYCQDADIYAAISLYGKYGWEIVQTCAENGLSGFDNWILIGGQNANPVFAAVFGDSIEADKAGYIHVQQSSAYWSGGKNRAVWGVAGWSASDTFESAQFVAKNGLPNEDVLHAGTLPASFGEDPRSYCDENPSAWACESEGYQPFVEKLISNGCGPQSGGGFIPDLNFGHVCDAHDFAYGLGTTGLDRENADTKLYEGIRDAGHPILAWVYWDNVRRYGWLFFNCSEAKIKCHYFAVVPN